MLTNRRAKCSSTCRKVELWNRSKVTHVFLFSWGFYRTHDSQDQTQTHVLFTFLFITLHHVRHQDATLVMKEEKLHLVCLSSKWGPESRNNSANLWTSQNHGYTYRYSGYDCAGLLLIWCQICKLHSFLGLKVMMLILQIKGNEDQSLNLQELERNSGSSCFISEHF